MYYSPFFKIYIIVIKKYYYMTFSLFLLWYLFYFFLFIGIIINIKFNKRTFWQHAFLFCPILFLFHFMSITDGHTEERCQIHRGCASVHKVLREGLQSFLGFIFFFPYQPPSLRKQEALKPVRSHCGLCQREPCLPVSFGFIMFSKTWPAVSISFSL